VDRPETSYEPEMNALSYAHGAIATPLLGETIGTRLRRSVDLFANQEAVVSVHQGFRATYCGLWELTGLAARGLMRKGIRKGDRVGIWSPNRYEWTVTQYAAARMGAILVNINPAYRPSELQYALNQSRVRLLLLARKFRDTDYVELLSQVRTAIPHLEEAVVLDDDWAHLLEAGSQVRVAELTEIEDSLQFDEPISIQYTSGTTGQPKGATLSHHNILNNGFFIGEALKYSAKDRVCLPVPLYHCFGMVAGNIACMSHGSCAVLPSEAFDALATLQAVESERCTSLYGVPTMFIGELDHPKFAEFNLTTLRTGMMGGSPCPIEVMRRVQSKMHMREATIAYGMTETSPALTVTAHDSPLEKRVTSVGRVLPHTEIKIVDPATGKAVPRGTQGELCARGYVVMLGYWDNDAATKTAIDSARWIHTGDLATMDDEAYINIVGRIKDVIIRGGENVYPREVEEFLYTHPNIAEVQVIGVPSEIYGEEVMAWVKVRGDTPLTSEQLSAYCQGRIAAYKIPRTWKFVNAFPMTITGKVQKFRMREIAIEELGLQQAEKIKTA